MNFQCFLKKIGSCCLLSASSVRIVSFSPKCVANICSSSLYSYPSLEKNKRALSLSNAFSLFQFENRNLSNKSNDSTLGKLLYVGKLETKLKKLLGVYYGLSVAAIICSPYLLSLTSHKPVGFVFLALHLSVFVVLNPILLYQFSKRYVNKLYFNKETNQYTALLLSPLILKEKMLQFTVKDCKMPATPSVFTSFYVGKIPLFVNSDDMSYKEYMEMLSCAEDLDYENPDRQEEYKKSIGDAVKQKQDEDERKKF